MTAEPGSSEGASHESAFHVVGIGASAGGLEALSALLDGLPESTGAAFIIVQHMAPDRSSILSELLSRHVKFPVLSVEGRVPVRPDHVYVIPPGVDMTIDSGHLDLYERAESSSRQFVIDRFLVSLARDQGERAIGVVLSGVGSDGTAGLASIKSSGGVTFAQDPETAGFDGMPRSAIEADTADIVATPTQIAQEILRLAGLQPVGAVGAGSASATVGEGADGGMKRILKSLRGAFGIDFNGYKEGTLRRRIHRRMILRHIESRDDYADLVAHDPDELEELYHDVLVTVTEFFRDPRTYEALKQTVIPRVIEHGSNAQELRFSGAWLRVGEEPYSLAMLVADGLRAQHRSSRVKILATDINERELAKARAGIYSEDRVAPIPPELRQRYMTSVDGVHQVIDELREMCIFSRHDVTRDPPFSRLHLIVCRNLLIYLGQALQERVLSLFHYALLPGGFLALGT